MEKVKNNENIKEAKKLPLGVSSSGNKFYYPIDFVYDDNVKCFVPVFGKAHDVYKEIQASAASTDIVNIVKRAKAGDISVLNVNQPSYADVSQMPDNLNDLHNLNLEALNGWSKLDSNLKKVFDNDFEKFAAAVEDNSYVEKINAYFKPKEDVKEEIKESE